MRYDVEVCACTIIRAEALELFTQLKGRACASSFIHEVGRQFRQSLFSCRIGGVSVREYEVELR